MDAKNTLMIERGFLGILLFTATLMLGVIGFATLFPGGGLSPQQSVEASSRS